MWVSIGNIEDGYPGNWLKWNAESFPDGPAFLVRRLAGTCLRAPHRQALALQADRLGVGGECGALRSQSRGIRLGGDAAGCEWARQRSIKFE